MALRFDCDSSEDRSLTEAPSDRERGRRFGLVRRGLGWGAGYGALLVSRIRDRALPVRPLLALGVLALAPWPGRCRFPVACRQPVCTSS